MNEIFFAAFLSGLTLALLMLLVMSAYIIWTDGESLFVNLFFSTVLVLFGGGAVGMMTLTVLKLLGYNV